MNVKAGFMLIAWPCPQLLMMFLLKVARLNGYVANVASLIIREIISLVPSSKKQKVWNCPTLLSVCHLVMQLTVSVIVTPPLSLSYLALL